MTLQDAIRMMGTTVTISAESDAALITDVTQRQAAHVATYEKKHLATNLKLPHKSAITAAIGVQNDIELRPISAMLELARGTALNNDPEIAAFARRWSTLRYLGIFARNAQTGKLHLDGAALEFIGPNQRRVLSEDLGIGFGIVVAKRWCKARTPAVGPITAIDVDIAIHNGMVPKLRPEGHRQPDYLLAYSDPMNPGAMVYDLLETKGTVSRSNAKQQLGRAVTQLAGLTIGGQGLTGIAVSTVSNSDGVFVMAVDPEEHPVTWRPTNEILERWRTTEVRPRKDDVKLDVSAEEFFATATNVDNASLAEFSGRHGAAKRWLPNFASARGGEENAAVRRTTEAGTFLGVEYVIEVPGTPARVRLFHGVEEHVVDGLNALDANAVEGAQRAFADSQVRETSMSPAAMEGIDVVSAVSSDGSMLEIRIE